jgi:hypothetical protein
MARALSKVRVGRRFFDQIGLAADHLYDATSWSLNFKELEFS